MNADEKDKEDRVIASEQLAQSEAKGSSASEAISTPDRRLLRLHMQRRCKRREEHPPRTNEGVIASELLAQSEAKGSSVSEAISTPDRRLLRREKHPPRNDTRESVLRLWLARLLIAVVVAWNLECALVFLLNPGAFAPGFELSGIPGEAAIRGFAVLFVMWNVPYLVALWQPRHNRASLWEALAMQGIGVIGESLILFSILSGYPFLHTAILRFIIFDASGVLLLSVAVFLSRK